MKFKVGDKVKIPKSKTNGNYDKFINEIKDFSNKDYLLIKYIHISNYISLEGPNHEYIGYDKFSKYDLELYKEEKIMNKTKQTVLSLDIAKKMYEGSDSSLKEFALLNFTKEELEAKELPKSWEELNFVDGYYIDAFSVVREVNSTKVSNPSKNIFPTKSLAEASLALSQLLQLRNAWWNGYDPYNSNKNNLLKSSIYYDQVNKEFGIRSIYSINSIFVFQTKELAQEFLDTFKELLWTARELI